MHEVQLQRLQRRRVPEGGQRLCTTGADRVPVEPDVQRAQQRRGVQLRKMYISDGRYLSCPLRTVNDRVQVQIPLQVIVFNIVPSFLNFLLKSEHFAHTCRVQENFTAGIGKGRFSFGAEILVNTGQDLCVSQRPRALGV